MPDFRAKMHQKSISAGCPPQTPLGADPLAGFGGPTSKGRGGDGRRGERRGGKKRGGEGKGRRKGKGEDDCCSKLF